MCDTVKHRRIETNRIWMHIVEKGEGPLVLLIHGFPQLSSSWNYQIQELALHGYHVVAPDMRGYGDSDSPPEVSSYTVFHLVGDLIALLDALGEQQTYVVGHDWGAQIAWHLCLFRPDRVKALVNLGVPYWSRSPQFKPTDFFNKMYGDGFYVSQYQEPGRAEKSFSKYSSLTILKKFLFINAPDLLVAPPGVELIDFLETPSSLPPWITEEELQYSATKFQKTGFTGPLNYYRAMNLNWELSGAWQRSKIAVPVKLIVGDKDVGFISFGTKDYIQGEEFKSLVPHLELVLIDGHHYIHQEKPELVTTEIIAFFGKNQQ